MCLCVSQELMHALVSDSFADILFVYLSLCQYHSETIKNIREAVESITSDPLYYRSVAIALDTKGPEIRTGLVKGVSINQSRVADVCCIITISGTEAHNL